MLPVLGLFTRHHPNQRVGGIGQYPFRYPVYPGDVSNRIYHADIGRSNVGRDITAGNCGNHDFGNTNIQCLHARCC